MVLLQERVATEVNAYTERVRKLKEAYLAARPYLCPERSRLIVESWKETEGEPSPIRWAKAYKKVLESIPVTIREGELVVGSLTKHIRGCYAYPEDIADTFIEQLQQEKLTASGEAVPCDIDEEGRKSILEDALYWKGKSASCQVKEAWEEIWGNKIVDFWKANLLPSVFFLETPPAPGASADYPRVLNKGLRGIIAEAQEQIEKRKADGSFEALPFLKAMIISCEGVITYARRHAQLARDMAKAETDSTRKAELERIAEICEWVPENPARNFHEALQSFWFIMLGLLLETPTSGKTPWRFDQYMYPFYKNSLSEGWLTRQQAAELLGCLWVKMQEVEQIKDVRQKQSLSSSLFINITIAGVKEDGSDATNELSYLILDVIRQVRVNTPHISVRYHEGIPEDFMIKALETCRDHGGGIPAFFNDKMAILSFVSTWGCSLYEARQYGIGGCTSKRPAYSRVFPGYYNALSLAKCFELALHNGKDPKTGKQLGPATGDPRNFTAFEDLYEAFKKQYAAAVDIDLQSQDIGMKVLSQWRQIPFQSALINGCIENGRDILADGARLNSGKGSILVHGHQNPANSLAAVKKLVFEDRAITMNDLMDALACNFEGKEDIQRVLLAAPKYGNDDDYVDEIMKDIFAWTEAILTEHANPWGGKYHIHRDGLSIHYPTGKAIGALPDGRKAGVPLADGSLSPMQGTDTKGPTAVLNSAAKIDIVGSASTILNQKLHPSMVQTREGIRKLLALIKTYFDRYGYHIQFNIINPETLLDAKKHPERYRDLVVRVAGYSAYFVELTPEVQDEIIARTTQMTL